MKKYISISLLLINSFVLFIGCEDNKEEFLDEYSTILYLRNSGEVPLTLYKTGEKTIYDLVVTKAGSNLNAVTEVDVVTLNEQELMDYNATYGVNYNLLPENCYSFSDTKPLFFDASDTYKIVPIELNTSEIEKTIEKNEDKTYVLPIKLTNSKDSINNEKQYLLLNPSVVSITVGFKYADFTNQTLSEGSGKENIPFTIDLSLNSIWDFSCKIRINENLVEAYNQEKETSLVLLPANSYTISSSIDFTANKEMESKGYISLDKSKLSYGNYLLPVELTEISKNEFLIDSKRNTSLIGISYVPDEGKLKPVSLTEKMLSSNSHAAEGSLSNLLDNDITSYFHSDYSGSVAPPHYLQVSLEQATTAFSFSFTARSSQGNGTPASITILGSLDGESFNKIGDITEGLPPGGAAGAGKSYTSPVMIGKEFKFLRLVINKNRVGSDYFVFSEFSLKTLN